MRRSLGGVEGDVLAALDHPCHLAVRQPVLLLQNAPHPDVGRGLEIGAPHLLADQVLRLTNAGGSIDEQEAVPETPVEEHGDGGERYSVIALHEIGADIGLADVELGLARHAPMTLARTHAGEHDEIEAVGLDRAFLERTHDLVVAARDRQPESFSHRRIPFSRRASGRNGPPPAARSH